MKTIIEHLNILLDEMEIMSRELREASVLPPEEAIRVLLGQESPRNSTEKPLESDFKDEPEAKSWCRKCGRTLLGYDEAGVKQEGESLCSNCA